MNGKLQIVISHHTGSEMCTKKEIYWKRKRKRGTHIWICCVSTLWNVTNTHTNSKKYVGTMNNTIKVTHHAIHKYTYAHTLNSHTHTYTVISLFLRTRSQSGGSKLFENCRFSIYSKCQVNRVATDGRNTHVHCHKLYWNQFEMNLHHVCCHLNVH